jgi:hypothetical protein
MRIRCLKAKRYVPTVEYRVSLAQAVAAAAAAEIQAVEVEQPKKASPPRKRPRQPKQRQVCMLTCFYCCFDQHCSYSTDCVFACV